MKRIFLKIIQSFRNAFRGLAHAYREELSFRLEFAGGIFLALVGYMFWPLKTYELLFLILSFCFVLTMELYNTALERILKRLHPGHHELVGVSKDLAAAGVLVAVLFAGIVVMAVAINHRFLL